MIFEPLLVPAGHDHEIQFNDDWWMFGSNPLFVWIDNTTRFGIGLGNPRDTIEVIHRMVFDPILFNTLVGEDSGASLTTGVRNTLGAYHAGYFLETSNDCAGWGYKVIGGAGDGIAIPATYKYTYISESAKIWGVPIIDGSIVGLNVGDAVNVGGGIVGINYDNASDDGELRFIEGDVVVINGTTNYDDAYTLTAGTSLTQLQFTSGFTAETFDGTETVVKLIESLHSSNGHIVQDSSGNLYYGHSVNTTGGTHYITKIETDGTQHPDYEWLTNTWDPIIDGGVAGLAITPDDLYLYVWLRGAFGLGYMYKFDLTTGDQVWGNPATGLGFGGGGYDMSIDEDGNAYAAITSGTIFCSKFDATDGSRTALTLMGQGKAVYVAIGCPYVALVDDDLGIVIAAGYQICSAAQDESVLYNLAVRTFDDSKGAQLAVGDITTSGGVDSTPLIGTGMVTVHNGYIYVLNYAPTCTLYKIQWDADDQTLTVIDSVAGPTYGQGVYFDLWGNLVVVNQDWTIAQTDVIYFYDEDLNYLSKVDSMESLMLNTWASTVGGSWIHGDAVFNGTLAVGANPDVHRVAAFGAYAAARIVEGADDGLYLGYKAGERVTTHTKGVFIGAYAGCHQTT
jgi:hypothetical protein